MAFDKTSHVGCYVCSCTVIITNEENGNKEWFKCVSTELPYTT